MMLQRLFVLTLAAMLAGSSVAQADPVSLPLPDQLQNNPIVQSVIQAIGGVLLQTTNGNTVHGRVTFFRRFEMQVETAPNVFRDVHLHQGTVINPRGATITQGMVVDVNGTPQADRSLNADQITTH